MVYISRNDVDNIFKYCISMAPKEACGLLAGDIVGEDRYIKKVYMLENIDDSETHFSMEPKEQIKAIKDMRELGLKMIGNFHSHPKSLAIPSAEDIRLAYESDVIYMIVSLAQGEADQRKKDESEDKLLDKLKAYYIIDNEQVIEEKIVVCTA